MTKRLRLVSCTLMIACAAASCSGSGSSDSANKSKRPASAATITTFEVPASVVCAAGDTSTTVTVQYAVSDSKRNRLTVDGLDVQGVGAPSGSVEVPVHCDPLPHTFVLSVYDAQNRRTSQQKNVNTVT